MYEPVMVIGTGRCGTSFVAGILHNDLNICMGLEFQKAKRYNPEGYYEDLEIKRHNDNLLHSYLTLQGWAKSIKSVMEQRIARNIPWGFKDPRLCDLIGFYLAMFDNPKIIWCIRDRDLVIKSMVERYEYPEKFAIQQHDIRMITANRLLNGRDHLKIDFGTERLSKEFIIKTIQNKWSSFESA